MKSKRNHDDHDHEFEATVGSPFLEDGKAFFFEECLYQPTGRSYTSERLDETFHEPAGPKCGAERQYHFDLTKVALLNNGRERFVVDVIDDDDERADWWSQSLDELVAEVLAAINGGSDPMADDVSIVKCNPDEEAGFLVVESDKFRARYDAKRDQK